MRLPILLLFFGFTNVLVIAQNYSYQGNVLDADSEEFIPFATVAIYNNDILVNGTTTDENGQFKLKAEKGFTHFDISFIGYENEKVKFSEIKTLRILGLFLNQQLQHWTK